MGKSKGPGPLARAKRFVVVSDTHGDMIDRDAERAFKEFVKVWKPEIRVHLGDIFDFRNLRKGACEGERAEDVAADYQAGCDFLDWFRPTHVLWGNHDVRLWDMFKSTTDGVTRDWCRHWIEDITDRLAGVNTYPFCKRHGVWKLGTANLIHGNIDGLQATRELAKVYNTVLHGHTHRIERIAVAGLDRRVGYNVGCLAKFDLGYNRKHVQTLQQAHGWAYGYVLPNQEPVVWQAEKVAGLWIVPSEMRSVG